MRPLCPAPLALGPAPLASPWRPCDRLSLSRAHAAVVTWQVLLVGVLIQTGESHWLAGIILVVAYLVISIGFFFHVDLPSPAA